nr:histidine kinase [Corynebacterium lactis]
MAKSSNLVVRITDAVIHSKRSPNKQPWWEWLLEAIWTPVIILAPALAQWPLNDFVRLAPPEAVFLDALGIFLGVAYMVSLGPVDRRIQVVADDKFHDKYVISSIFAAKRLSMEEFLFLLAFFSIFAASWYLGYPWPLGSSWTLIVYCAVFAALFDRAKNEPTRILAMVVLAEVCVMAFVPSLLFVPTWPSFVYHPAMLLTYILVSTGIGLMVQSQRFRMRFELEKSETESLLVENRVRQEISHELHDVVAHEVAGIVVLSQATKMIHASGTASPEYIDEALDKIEEASKRALASIRSTVEDLRKSDRHEADGAASSFPEIAEVIDNFERNRRMELSDDDRDGEDGLPRPKPVVVDIDEKTRDYLSPSRGLISAEMGNALYRLVSESLTNIYRHSPGSNVFISVRVSLLPSNVTKVFEQKPADTSSVKHFSRDTFLADHPSLAASVDYPRVEVFVFDTGSSIASAERKGLGGGNGIGIANIRRSVKELGGVSFTGAYRPKYLDGTQERPGWLVFCTLPLKK